MWSLEEVVCACVCILHLLGLDDKLFMTAASAFPFQMDSLWRLAR